jgi:hypothetical protein
MDSDKSIEAVFKQQDSTSCLIGNAGFESGMRSWINDAGATISEDANSGLKALKLSTIGEIIDDALIKVDSQLYVSFTFFAKKTTDMGRASMGIEFLDTNQNRLTSVLISTFSTSYEKISIVKELPQRTAFLRIVMKKETDKGSLFVDDLCLAFSKTNPNAFLLTVENGTGSGYYEENTMVLVEANKPESGQRFAVWTGDTEWMTNPESSYTRVRMPAKAVTVSATYEPTVGVDDFIIKTPKAAIFPNPTNNYFWVEGLNEFEYHIKSIDGKEVMKGKASGTSKINIDVLSDGIYILKLESEGWEQTEKLIVQ